jgi:pyridoxal phosphate enzyme (YggS family)
VTDPPSADAIRDRHDRLLRRLREVAEAHGKDPDRLRIVGVTKGHPLEVVATAVRGGLMRLGESRIQEAAPKVAAFPDVEWHFIGRLQSNKARRAVRGFPVIHSIDSLTLLDRVDRIGAEEGRRPRVLLEVNVSGEASKAGLRPEQLDRVVAPAAADLVGLMTIAPFGATDEQARRVFAELRALRDALEQRIGQALPELSMGMSADAEAAAAEGATYVRIGTALFGPRH